MTPKERDNLGLRIRRLREEQDLSLSDLEKKSGVTKGYLSQIERGEAINPSLEAVRKIAQGLEVQITDLIGENNEKKNSIQRIPKGLKEYINKAKTRGTPLTDEDITMLQGIRYRGKVPKNADEYGLLFDFLKRFIR